MEIRVGDKIKLKKFDENKIWHYTNGPIDYYCKYYTEAVGTVTYIDKDGAFRVSGFTYITWACKEMVEFVEDSINYYLQKKEDGCSR